MKTKIIFFYAVLAGMASTYGQKPAIELTFTAVDSAFHVPLDSIKVMNRTRGGDTVLYYPDTVLVLEYQVGIHDVDNNKYGLQVFQNYPNPVNDQTTITLFVPENDKVDFTVTDILGRQVIHSRHMLDKGYHSFRFTPGNGNIFFFTAQWKGHSSSIKILHSASDSYLAGSLDYIGYNNTPPQLKTTEAVQSFSFSLGDTLLYVGYTDTLQSGMPDAPQASETFTFQFATNIPCPGIPTVTYEGQVYHTIQLFSQCWLKENLNVGTMIQGDIEMTDNGIIEKYCYNDEADSCTKYGGLYQWDEMMQYIPIQGVQGICPPGWHIPTDEEWKVLEGSVDGYYGIGDLTWDDINYRGFDAGLNLKSTSGWTNGGNGSDMFGFSALPGGVRHNEGGFFTVGNSGSWWTATDNDDFSNSWGRGMGYLFSGVSRYFGPGKTFGFSVRCLKDY